MKYVITLVHGTWARKAGWTRRGSPLCKALINKLGGDVEFTRTVWNGKNSITGRTEGAQRLIRRLRHQLLRVPEAKHFVIAHSHAGNIALYALREDPKLKQQIAGIACLATPFLHGAKRDLGPLGQKGVSLGLFLLLFTIAVAVQLRFYPATNFLWFSSAVTLLFIGATVLLIQWEKLAKGWLEQLKLGMPEPDRLFIARLSGDEASAGMLTAQFLTSLTTRIVSTLAAHAARVERRGIERAKRLAWLSRPAMVAVGLGYPLFFILRYLELVPSVAGISGLLATAGVLFLLWQLNNLVVTIYQGLIGLLTFGSSLAMSLVLLVPFGWRIAASNLFLNVTTEVTPPGMWAFRQFPIEEEATEHASPQGEVGERIEEPPDLSAPPLRHSAVYEDRQVLERLAQWMTEVERPL